MVADQTGAVTLKLDGAAEAATTLGRGGGGGVAERTGRTHGRRHETKPSETAAQSEANKNPHSQIGDEASAGSI